jgi:hypothetical protein
METNWKFALVPAQALDMEVTSYLGEEVVCSGDELPIAVRLTNLGANDFVAGNAEALTVQMIVNGEVVLASDWSGSLATYQSVDFTLGTYVFAGATDFTIAILASDENTDNDELSVSVDASVPATTQWEVQLNTDSYGNETGWELRNSLGALINLANPGTYQGETTYEFTLSLPATDCYTFVLTDTYGDGMFGSMWGGINGSCVITSVDGDGNPTNVIFDYDGSFGFDELAQTIDANQTLVVSELGDDIDYTLQSFPNPFVDVLNITALVSEGVHGATERIELEVLDMHGRLIHRSQENILQGESIALDASAWPVGPVLVRWSSASDAGAFRVIKNR